jgi:Uncharacterised ArCR, COG2043
MQGSGVLPWVPSDHYNCPIGSYTHSIPLPQARVQELDQTLSLMAGIGYVRMEEVPGIPRLPQTPGVIIYAPLADTPVDPDVVLFAGRPGRMMLLQEAAVRAASGTASLVHPIRVFLTTDGWIADPMGQRNSRRTKGPAGHFVMTCPNCRHS